MKTLQTAEEIIEGSKLIANYMGFIYPYKCDIWRAGYNIMNVDLLSKIVFPSVEEVLASEENNEAVPYFGGGNLHPQKYGLERFWKDVIVFSTDSQTIHPCVRGYNERASAYHCSWDWLMKVVKKIHGEDYKYTISPRYDINSEFDYMVDYIEFINEFNKNK